MESFLRNWLLWPSIETFLKSYAWAWPLMEVMHFVGLCLLVGLVGMFDLRLLGFAKGVPVRALSRLIPWGVFGFAMAAASGLVFLVGGRVNFGVHPYQILINDGWLQLKLIFIALAGLNLLLFYITGAAREADEVGPGQDTNTLAKVIGATSIVLWLGVVYFGRLIPWGSLGE
ncbi:MAG: hypothetical protein AB7I50_20525 [Vicinamibacterales bacterium]